MSPRPSASVKTHFADVEAVVRGLPALAQLALVRVGLAPPLLIHLIYVDIFRVEMDADY